MLLGELSKALEGKLQGPFDLPIENVALLEKANPLSIVFASNVKQAKAAEASSCGAVLIPPISEPFQKPAIVVKNPKLAFARLLALFYPSLPYTPGVHKTALVDKTACVGHGTQVSPYAVIGKKAKIGERVFIGPFVLIEEEAEVGDDSVLFARVSLLKKVRVGKRCILYEGAVIGSQGFGYVLDEEGFPRHIPQVGTVVLEDDVEIGANSTVDRATLAETRIGRGTKIDNLVHVGHNCRIGENCLVAGLTGFSGSVEVGGGTVIGGQVGVRDHVKIGEKVQIAGGAMIWGDVPPFQAVSGIPARSHRDQLKIYVLLDKLPEMVKRIEALEKGKKPFS